MKIKIYLCDAVLFELFRFFIKLDKLAECSEKLVDFIENNLLLGLLLTDFRNSVKYSSVLGLRGREMGRLR